MPGWELQLQGREMQLPRQRNPWQSWELIVPDRKLQVPDWEVRLPGRNVHLPGGESHYHHVSFCAIARFACSALFIDGSLGFRSTPGFMLSPAPPVLGR